MILILGFLLGMDVIPHHVEVARTDIQDIYWNQLSKETDAKRFSEYVERIKSYQTEIILGFQQGRIDGESAFRLYQGSLSYLAAGFRKIGWHHAAAETYQDGLELVKGTDEEVFMLLNLADVHVAKESKGSNSEGAIEALSLFERVLDLPQFLETDRKTQQLQMQMFFQKSNLEAYVGDYGSAYASLEDFIAYSHHYQIPLTDKALFTQAVKHLNAKTGLAKRGGELMSQLASLEKASADFPIAAQKRDRAISVKKVSNFEKFTTVSK